MIPVSKMKNGTVFKMEGVLYKVVSHEIAGAGKMGRVVHAKLKNLGTGTMVDRRFRAEDQVDEIRLDSFQMEYLYNDGDDYYFMNTVTYEQVMIKKDDIGPGVQYLKPNMQFQIELYEGKPINVHFPEFVEEKIASTGAGIHGQTDSTYKEATLENGVKIMVPQFIKEGDTVKIKVETNSYVDRIKK